MAKKRKIILTDNLNENDKKKIKTALRQVWNWSHSRRLVLKRCDIGEGYSRCEKCKKKCPKIFVDHIEAVGSFDLKIIERMFVPSQKLQGLCKKCHSEKTKADNKKTKEKALLDFY